MGQFQLGRVEAQRNPGSDQVIRAVDQSVRRTEWGEIPVGINRITGMRNAGRKEGTWQNQICYEFIHAIVLMKKGCQSTFTEERVSEHIYCLY